MATAEASSCGEKRKEVVVSFIATDSPYDAFENTKMKILLTTSKSSSRGEVISFVDYEEKTEFMTVKPREISEIVEQGKKYLCLEYGPKSKAKFILLDFTDESRENLDEWNVFLCRMMGLESKPKRRNTVNDMIIHRQKMAPVLRTISAFLPTYTPIFGSLNSGEASNSPDGVLGPPSSGPASGSESPEISDGDSTSDMSSFGSLKSMEYRSLTDILIYDCPKDLLSQHQFKDYQEEIVVTQSVPDSKLHPGDTIVLITGEGATGEGTAGEGTTPKNAEKLREYILKTEAPTIMLAVVRGVEIKMKDGEQDLTINIRGPKTQRPDAVEAVLKGCNPRLAIAEINGAPIPVGTQEDQVAQILREALEGDSPEGHLYLIPRSLMTADDEESDTVQETRPINVEGNSSVSGNTTTTGNEETEC